jgi:hypothetical protein
MGMLDILKSGFGRRKHATAEFRPTTSLEELIDRAARDPAHRPEVFRRIFHSRLLMLGEMAEAAPGSGAEGRRLRLMTPTVGEQGTRCAVAFSSLAAIDHMCAVRGVGRPPYVTVPATEAFRRVVDLKLGLLMNPDVHLGFMLSPALVSAIWTERPAAEAWVPPAGTAMYFGMPREWPAGLLETLRGYAAGRDEIRALYAGLCVLGENGYEYFVAVDAPEAVTARMIQELELALGEQASRGVRIVLMAALPSHRELAAQGGLVTLPGAGSAA